MRDTEIRTVAMEVLGDLSRWATRCHEASAALVTSQQLGDARIARGLCHGVATQHSWVVLSKDAYDSGATIVDPTLWHYDSTLSGIWLGSYRDLRHWPHGGWQSIRDWHGSIPTGAGPPIALQPAVPLSKEARAWLRAFGPLDKRGWVNLASDVPVHGWPADEVFSAIANTPGPAGAVPIDRIGMLTERESDGIYPISRSEG